jgi:hypothetical protein
MSTARTSCEGRTEAWFCGSFEGALKEEKGDLSGKGLHAK